LCGGLFSPSEVIFGAYPFIGGLLRALSFGARSNWPVESMSVRHTSLQILSLLSCWLCGIELSADFSELGSVQALPGFTVTAWHFPEEVLDLPANVVRIERAQIERSATMSVPELLQSEANVFFRSTSARVSNGEISMRGFGENSGLRSLVLVNGQPMNPSDMGGIDWEQVPLDSIESVEVLHGGQNVLYGDRALAGVIKIETRQAAGTHLEMKGDVGSYAYHRESVNASTMSEAWAVRVGGSWMSEDGYRDHSETWSRNINAGVEYFFESGDRIDFFVSSGKIFSQLPGPLIYEDYRSDPRSSFTTGKEEATAESGGATLQVHGDRLWGNYTCSIGYDSSATDWAQSGLYGVNEQTGWTMRPRVQFREQGHRLIVGTDVIYDTLDFYQYLDESHESERSNADIEEGRVSPYIFAEQALTDQLTLSGGVRYEWTRFEIDNQTYVADQLNPLTQTNRGTFRNPNYKNPADLDPDQSYAETLREHGGAVEVSLNYRLSDQLSAWVGYDHNYRYPVFDERAAYQGVALAEPVSGALEAEQGDGVDLGFKYIGERNQVHLTGYALWMDNEIGFVEDPVSGLGLNVNVGGVHRYGADFSWAYVSKHFGCSMRVACVRTEMRSGAGRGHSVPLVPSVHTTNQVWYELMPDVRLTVVHRYIGEQYQGGDFENDLKQIDDYHVVDARIQYQVNEHSSVYVKGTNLLDQLFAESAYSGAYYPGMGRAIYAGVILKF
jgi:iron complex outermembrane receptor protein